MKTQYLLMNLTAGLLLAPAAFAQVEFNVTGATAFQAAVRDRITNYVFDIGQPMTIVNSTRPDGTVARTISGKFSANVAGLVGQDGIIRDSFTGSADGVRDVKNGYNIQFSTLTAGVLTNMTADCAFSDVAPAAARVSAKASDFFGDTKLGIVPFVFAKSPNADMAGVTNITRDQALQLFASDGLMNASFLGGGQSGNNPVYLVGRDEYSGTRITTEKCVGNSGALFQYDILSGTLRSTNGYASGSLARNAFATNVVFNLNYNLISYLQVTDARTLTNANQARLLAYNGVEYSTNNVQNGSYAIWGYEHMMGKKSISGNQLAIYNALRAGITNAAFQNSSATFVINYLPLNSMQAVRDGDGTPPYIP